MFTDILCHYLEVCACHHNPQVWQKKKKKRWSCIYGGAIERLRIDKPLQLRKTASELLVSSFPPPSFLSSVYHPCSIPPLRAASVRAGSPCRRTCGLPIADLDKQPTLATAEPLLEKLRGLSILQRTLLLVPSWTLSYRFLSRHLTNAATAP